MAQKESALKEGGIVVGRTYYEEGIESTNAGVTILDIPMHYHNSVNVMFKNNGSNVVTVTILGYAKYDGVISNTYYSQDVAAGTSVRLYEVANTPFGRLKIIGTSKVADSHSECIAEAICKN